MTDKTVRVRVRARVSFHDIRQGDESDVVLDSVMQGWINGGFMEVIGGGKSPARQGGTVPNNPGRLKKGAGRRVEAGGEPGEGVGAGGHGPVEGVDPS